MSGRHLIKRGSMSQGSYFDLILNLMEVHTWLILAINRSLVNGNVILTCPCLVMPQCTRQLIATFEKLSKFIFITIVLQVCFEIPYLYFCCHFGCSIGFVICLSV